MQNRLRILPFIFIFALAISVNAQAKKNKNKTVTFDVSMHCQSCVNRIEKNISFEKGVKDLEVHLPEKTVKITFDTLKTNADKLKKSIEKLGYEVKVNQPMCQ